MHTYTIWECSQKLNLLMYMQVILNCMKWELEIKEQLDRVIVN